MKVIIIRREGKLWLSRKAAIPNSVGRGREEVRGRNEAHRQGRASAALRRVRRARACGGRPDSHGRPLDQAHRAPEEVVKVGDSLDVVVASLDAGVHKNRSAPGPRRSRRGRASPARADQQAREVRRRRRGGGWPGRPILGATGRNARGFVTAAATGTAEHRLRKPFPVGTQMDAKVVEIDPRRGEVKLSIKGLREDTERNAYQQYRAQVKQEAKFGTFADFRSRRRTRPPSRPHASWSPPRARPRFGQ